MAMAFQCLRSPWGYSSFLCSSSAPVHLGTSAALLSYSSLSSVSSRDRNGVRWAAARGAPMSRSRTRIPPFCVRAGIRAVETYDASFELLPECDQTLRDALSSKVFCAQVAEQTGADETYEFTGELFQPVPWSPTTKFGMPVEFERYLLDKDNFTIINVPPNFMFKAKVEADKEGLADGFRVVINDSPNGYHWSVQVQMAHCWSVQAQMASWLVPLLSNNSA